MKSVNRGTFRVKISPISPLSTNSPAETAAAVNRGVETRWTLPSEEAPTLVLNRNICENGLSEQNNCYLLNATTECLQISSDRRSFSGSTAFVERFAEG